MSLGFISDSGFTLVIGHRSNDELICVMVGAGCKNLKIDVPTLPKKKKTGRKQYRMEGTMLGKKIRYWAMCFVLGYIENGQKKFAKDSDMYKAYEKVILDVQGKYKYR